MGKIYTKPDIVFESFSLSTSVAASCEVRNNTPSTNQQCGFKFGPVTVFLENMTGCSYKLPLGNDNWMDENGNSFCYHNPSDDNNLFGS